MTLTDAKALRDEILRTGIHCTVPLGHGPNGYWAQIVSSTCAGVFHSAAEWQAYKWEMEERQFRTLHPPRSALDMLIDKACGLS